jgi:hypothetical protein
MSASQDTGETDLNEQFKQKLLECGLLTEIKPCMAEDPLANERRLVHIEGKPVSEIIIEERR